MSPFPEVLRSTTEMAATEGDDGFARSVTETPAGGLTQDTRCEGGTFDAVWRGGALDGR